MGKNLSELGQELGSLKHDLKYITMYGTIDDISATSASLGIGLSFPEVPDPPPHGYPEGGLRLALIKAVKSFKLCITLPSPVLIPVWSEGESPAADDTCAPPGSKKWDVPRDWQTFTLAPEFGTAEELLEKEPKGVDAEWRNLRWEGDRYCGEVRFNVSVRIGLRRWRWTSPWVPFSVRVSGCVTVFEGSAGPARVKIEICLEGNQICGVLHARVFGIGDSWRRCTGIGYREAAVSDKSVGCAGAE